MQKTKRSNRLGKGLSALIPDLKDDIDRKDVVEVELNKIYTNESQPRRYFDEEKIDILCESIKNHGVLQPIVLKPDENGKFMIIAGERRYRASVKSNLKKIPAVIKDIPMKSVMEIALIENLQREDLNAIEEALAYKNLINSHNVTQEEISESVGKSRPHITNTLRLLNLCEEVISLIYEGKITAGHGKALLKISDKINQINLANRIIKEELSVRDVEAITKKMLDGEKNLGSKNVNKDIFILDIEDKLTDVFGTKVNIHKGKKKGKIEIEYYTDEDLNNIISTIIG